MFWPVSLSQTEGFQVTGDDLLFEELPGGQEATTILTKAPDLAAAEEVMEVLD